MVKFQVQVYSDECGDLARGVLSTVRVNRQKGFVLTAFLFRAFFCALPLALSELQES